MSLLRRGMTVCGTVQDMERIVMTVEWWLSRVCIKGCEHIRRTATAAGTCISKQGALETPVDIGSVGRDKPWWQECSLSIWLLFPALQNYQTKTFSNFWDNILKKFFPVRDDLLRLISPCEPHGGMHMKEKMNRQAYQLPMTNRQCGEKGRDRYC